MDETPYNSSRIGTSTKDSRPNTRPCSRAREQSPVAVGRSTKACAMSRHCQDSRQIEQVREEGKVTLKGTGTLEGKVTLCTRNKAGVEGTFFKQDFLEIRNLTACPRAPCPACWSKPLSSSRLVAWLLSSWSHTKASNTPTRCSCSMDRGTVSPMFMAQLKMLQRLMHGTTGDALPSAEVNAGATPANREGI